MVKIPGTAEGVCRHQDALTEGININITLLFSLENYERVALAYVEALEDRLGEGQADRPRRLGRIVLRQPGRHDRRQGDRRQDRGRRAERRA